MKVVVFGSTGGTGRAFVEQALESGHEVTAFLRDPEKLRINHERLNSVQGDARNEADVRRAVLGQEAVVSCLGSESLKDRSTLTVMTENMVTAAAHHGVTRLLYVASAGLYNEIPGWTGWMSRMVLRNVLHDHRQAVNAVIAAGMDYTIARPMRLLDGPVTGNYRTAETVPEGGRSISRGDVAHFLLHALEEGTYVKETTGLAD
ncbi:NAD(P)H-binding protein [Halobacillus litoralis]|uniref:NAD(P)H-binding protein n=1 Tax=Halobacillus litoralis TaxID=45668 RepID=A0A845DSZ6_9BACI|nr:NAD(P)-binding oxidoreductase [Halobacillus litoralis]MYL20723.1 NAD(P)H-binding protein [Halobacillus litoralis]